LELGYKGDAPRNGDLFPSTWGLAMVFHQASATFSALAALRRLWAALPGDGESTNRPEQISAEM